jgi:plasmid stabilization system protein ParE
VRRFDVELLPEAIDDANQHADHIALDSVESAITWLDGLFEAVQTLALMPRRCPLAPGDLSHGREMRVMLYYSHHIYYVVEPGRVVVVHIRHAARDVWRPAQPTAAAARKRQAPPSRMAARPPADAQATPPKNPGTRPRRRRAS